MTIDDARKSITKSIATIYGESEAKNIADLVVEHITKKSRIESFLQKQKELSAEQTKLLDQSIDRLKKHEPVQYVTNECWFANMKFYVNKNVLIPRPETEELVDWVIRDMSLKAEVRSQRPEVRILDVGTGSGCIAIVLKKKFQLGEIWACDISDEALNIARMNADLLNATIDFVGLDFLDPIQRNQLPQVDLVISNPPYVPEIDKIEMKKNVADHEPATALFVTNDDPLAFYKAIAEFGKEKLNKNGNIYAEIHEDFAKEIGSLFSLNGYQSVEIRKDLQGKDRMIKVSVL
jgi:release factor glutamine methyltransferase